MKRNESKRNNVKGVLRWAVSLVGAAALVLGSATNSPNGTGTITVEEAKVVAFTATADEVEVVENTATVDEVEVVDNTTTADETVITIPAANACKKAIEELNANRREEHPETDVMEPSTVTEEVKTAKVDEVKASASSKSSKKKKNDKKKEKSSDSWVVKISDEEHTLLLKIVFHESGNESYETQVGIANAIFNRMNDPAFPNTLKEVLYQKNQFVPDRGGDIYWNAPDGYRPIEMSDIPESVFRAVEDALNGTNTIGNREYFYSERWISQEQLALRKRSAYDFAKANENDDTIFHNW